MKYLHEIILQKFWISDIFSNKYTKMRIANRDYCPLKEYKTEVEALSFVNIEKKNTNVKQKIKIVNTQVVPSSKKKNIDLVVHEKI